MTSSYPVLPGYEIIETLYHRQQTLVVRAVRQTDQRVVILKMLANNRPSLKQILRFRNQYMMTHQLHHPGIGQVEALVPIPNGYALVMPSEQTIPLNHYLEQQTHAVEVGLPLSEVLTIGIQLADVLHYLQQHRIIHKDIKPANILIYPETLNIQLIDFGFASLLPHEEQELRCPTQLEGTLAYMAPEQTGRMNRGIDYRVDFYSLGVTLYELLTGQRPFVATDRLELIYSHLAHVPVPPCEIVGHIGEYRKVRSKDGWIGLHQAPSASSSESAASISFNLIPKTLSDIVVKLMAKNAEDRYQSGLGLKYDLEYCLRQWQETRAISELELGQRDRCDRLLLPQCLYGRDAEVQRLLDAFERVSGRSKQLAQRELLLVAGFSGVGKTAVIREVYKPITRQKGYFIQGKFDQLNRNIPFSAFVQAFRNLMGQILGESDAELMVWKTTILNAVGESGQVLIDVIPELEHIIGVQPPVPKLSGTAAQNRFNLLFGKFVQVFTCQGHPLIIFLDDLQWVDAASLNLLNLLMQDSGIGADTGYLLLLGAYRDNEVTPVHPLMLTLKELEVQGAVLNTLTLNPLTLSDATQLVSDTLSNSTDLAVQLTQRIYPITQGNPFFTLQFLQGLQEEGCLHFDQEFGAWQCDLVKVQRLALPEDVVDFMVRRLLKLPETTREVLKLAACIGNEFDLITLAIVCEKSQQQVAQDLWRSLQVGLIIPENETYQVFQSDLLGLGEGYDEIKLPSNIKISYRFLHDRVQQAAYALIVENHKQTTHLKIGRLLWQNTPDAERDDYIFAITHHLNLGIDQVPSSAERHKIAQMNLLAGQKAKASTAYSAALSYFNAGISLLPLSPWQSDYPLTLSLYNEATEASYLSGDFTALTDLIDSVLHHAQAHIDTASVYESQIGAYIAQDRPLDAIHSALEFLRPIGIEFPDSPTDNDVAVAAQEIKTLLRGRVIIDLAQLPTMENPELQAALRILVKVDPATFIAKPDLYPLFVQKQVALVIQHGNTPASAFTYAVHGLMLSGQTDSINMGYEFGQLALTLLSKFPTQEYRARTLAVAHMFVMPWCEPLSDSLLPLLEAYTSGLSNGDLTYGGYGAQFYCLLAYTTGQELSKLANEFSNYAAALKKINQQTTLNNYFNSYYQVILNLINAPAQPWELTGPVYDEQLMQRSHEKAGDQNALWHLFLNKVMVCYLFAQIALAEKYLQKAKQYSCASYAMAHSPLLNMYDSLIQLAIFPNAAAAQQQQILQHVSENQNSLEKWSSYAPMNQLHRVHLVGAEQSRVLGHYPQAMAGYDQAISLAKDNGYIQEAALGNELAAKFYLDWGKEKFAAGYMQEAYACYACWGAKAKTDALEALYSDLLCLTLQFPKASIGPVAPLSMDQVLIASTSLSVGNLNASDFVLIMKSAQALSQLADLNVLMQQLADLSLKSSGAQTCMIAYPLPNDEWSIYSSSNTMTCQSLQIPTFLQPDDYPLRLINWAKNTKTAIAIDPQGPLDIVDPYLIAHQPQSAFCSPIIRCDKVLGILYLEHHQAVNLFTKRDQTVLDFLCTQAAIALDNAALSQQSQILEVERNFLGTILSSIPQMSWLNELEQYYQSSDAAQLGVIFRLHGSLDGRKRFLRMGTACHQLFQVSAEAVEADADYLLSMIHPVDLIELESAILASAGAKTFLLWEGRFEFPWNSSVLFRMVARPASQADGTTVWDGVFLTLDDALQLENTPKELVFIEETFLDQFRKILSELLKHHQASEVNIAAKLGLSPRTLRRRLKKEDTSFQMEIAQMRIVLAKHYLLKSNLPCKQIANLIGYENPNSFTRAFNKMMGISPTEYRTTHQEQSTQAQSTQAQSS